MKHISEPIRSVMSVACKGRDLDQRVREVVVERGDEWEATVLADWVESTDIDEHAWNNERVGLSHEALLRREKP